MTGLLTGSGKRWLQNTLKLYKLYDKLFLDGDYMMSESVRYLRLTDLDNRRTVVKQVGTDFYGYENGTWSRRGLSIGYFYPDAPEFECYDAISEDEALKLINEM